jgi:hypothetical protein
MSATSLLPTFKPNGSRAALKQMMPFALRCYMTESVPAHQQATSTDKMLAGRGSRRCFRKP